MVSPIVWKEWHEQRWKMAFGTVMLVFFAGTIAAARVMSAREAVAGVWIIGGMILSLYSAMGVFAPERVGGTLVFLASKPLDARKVFLCKWLFGWLNVMVPIAASGLLVLAVEGRQIWTWEFVVQRPLIGLSMATMLYTMTCCLAPRRAGEAQVGFFGLMVLLTYFLHIVLVQSVWWSVPGVQQSLPVRILAALNPLYLLELLGSDGARRALVVLPVQVIVFVLILWVGYRKWRRSI